MLGTVWLITASFLCCARFVAVFGLAALLVAKFKADPELSHVTARENVWDPVNHKRAGLLLICCSCSRNSSVNMAVQADFRCKRRKTKERKKSYSPTLRKVRSSIGRIACGRSDLHPSSDSNSGGGSGQRKCEYEPSAFFTKLWVTSSGSCWARQEERGTKL